MTSGPTTNTNTKTSSAGTGSQIMAGTNVMAGTTSGDTSNTYTGGNTSTGTSSVTPYGPTGGMLTALMNSLSPATANAAELNPAQEQGLTGVETAASKNATINPQIWNITQGMLNGGGFGTGVPGITAGQADLGQSLTPIAEQSTDPSQNPQVKAAMDAINYQVQNDVGGQFSAAGRGMPGSNAGLPTTIAATLAREEAPMLLNEQNTLTGQKTAAANSLLSGDINASAALDQSNAQALAAKEGAPGMLAQSYLPFNELTQAGTQVNQLPEQNVGMLSSIINPIAQMFGTTNYGQTGQQAGGTTGTSSTANNQATAFNADTNSTSQSTGKGSSTQSQSFSPLSLLASGVGAFLASDPDVKTGIQPVGMLFDGTPVHKFRYKGSKTTRIGLMSPQVRQRVPQAVKTGSDGFDKVNYDMATRPSAMLAPSMGVH